VVPTDFDIYSVKSFVKNALLQPAPRAAYAKLVEMGWTDALRELHSDEPMFTFWSYLRNRWPRDAGLRLDHLLLSPVIAPRLKAAGVDRDVRGVRTPAITHQLGSNLRPQRSRSGNREDDNWPCPTRRL
jgi:exodeoxyribonuclease III